MAKKKPKPKRVEIKLPVPHNEPHPEELIVIPVPVDHAAAMPLTESVGPIKCILTLKEIYVRTHTEYVVRAVEGQTLPIQLKTGQEVEVTFSPPK